MPFTYSPLWRFLESKNISKETFLSVTGMSDSSFATLERDTNTSLSLVDTICSSLNCTLAEVVEYTPTKTFEPLDTLASLLKSVESRLITLENLLKTNEIKQMEMPAQFCDTDTDEPEQEDFSETSQEQKPSLKFFVPPSVTVYYDFNSITPQIKDRLEEDTGEEFISLNEALDIVDVDRISYLSNALHTTSILKGIKVKELKWVKLYVTKSSVYALKKKAEQEGHSAENYLPKSVPMVRVQNNRQKVFSNDKELNSIITQYFN